MGGMGWQVGGRFEREGTYVCAVLYSVASVVSHSVIPLTVGPAVHGIFQARILEWTAISSSRESS